MITRGSIVRILRKESYWFNQTGSVATVDKSKVNYPILVTVLVNECLYTNCIINIVNWNKVPEQEKNRKYLV